jgi:hypothetical protein
VPPIAFAIVFGLSMDYEVFLMSRIREEHVHGLRTRAAVEHGMAAIGRVVVAGGADHGHRVRGVHPRRGPGVEGVRASCSRWRS